MFEKRYQQKFSKFNVELPNIGFIVTIVCAVTSLHNYIIIQL